MMQFIFESTIGRIYLVASDRGLKGAYWYEQAMPLVASLAGDKPALKILSAALVQLEEFLNGERTTFDLKYDVDGTDFQKKVWSELAKIPYGQTVSYTDIARRLKNEKAVRAVGTANGRNPLSIIIPCHRVITASGELGGYNGGLERKTKLLALERAHGKENSR